jgi:hypothetical protein
MPKVTDNLRNAQILADFCNLEAAAPPGHLTHPEYFRNNYPDFAPKGWWDSHYTGERDWEPTQKLLRHAWRNQFLDGIYYLLRILESVTAPSRLADADQAQFEHLTAAHRKGIEKVKEMFGERAAEEMAKKKAKSFPVPSPHVRESDYIPMQRAIVYLFEHSWRARFCAECNKRFVAAEPKNKFCSEACSNENRLRQKREWFRDHGKEWRKKWKKRKTAERATFATKTGRIRSSRKPHV